jgi:hypothetical protein
MRNPTILSMLVKEHQNRLLEEAKKSRMPKTTGATKACLRGRLCMRAGEFLIHTGQRLQERYRPEMYPCPKVYRSKC